MYARFISIITTIMATKRINIILSDTLIRTIDRLVKSGERSRFIDRAIQHYVATRSAESVHEQLKQAGLRDRDIDREIGEDWAAVDYEPWHIDERKEEPGRTAGRSISRASTQQ